jgi:hypothetical protein
MLEEEQDLETEPVESEAQTEGEETSESEEIDYKAELAKLEKERDEARKLAEKRLNSIKAITKSKAEKIEDEDADDVSGETTPSDINKQVAEMTAKQFDDFKKDFLSDTVEDLLFELTDNEDERKLVKHFYDNRINHSGYSKAQIKEDLRLAMAGANIGRLENSLLKKAKKQVAEREAASQGAAKGTGRQPPASSKNLNSEEKSFMDSIDNAIDRNYPNHK